MKKWFLRQFDENALCRILFLSVTALVLFHVFGAFKIQDNDEYGYLNNIDSSFYTGLGLGRVGFVSFLWLLNWINPKFEFIVPAAHWVSAIALSISISLWAEIFRSFFQKFWQALFFTAVLALNPPVLFCAFLIHPDNLEIFWLTLGFYFILKPSKNWFWRIPFLMSGLTKEAALFYPVVTIGLGKVKSGIGALMWTAIGLLVGLLVIFLFDGKNFHLLFQHVDHQIGLGFDDLVNNLSDIFELYFLPNLLLWIVGIYAVRFIDLSRSSLVRLALVASAFIIFMAFILPAGTVRDSRNFYFIFLLFAFLLTAGFIYMGKINKWMPWVLVILIALTFEQNRKNHLMRAKWQAANVTSIQNVAKKLEFEKGFVIQPYHSAMANYILSKEGSAIRLLSFPWDWSKMGKEDEIFNSITERLKNGDKVFILENASLENYPKLVGKLKSQFEAIEVDQNLFELKLK